MMEYNMPYQHSIIIGNYNDFNFFPSILLDFKENKYFEMYFQSFIIDGYDETMKSINTKNYLMLKIYDNSKEIAYAYNLDMIENKGENIQAQNSSSQIQNNNSSNNQTINNLFIFYQIILTN